MKGTKKSVGDTFESQVSENLDSVADYWASEIVELFYVKIVC